MFNPLPAAATSSDLDRASPWRDSVDPMQDVDLGGAAFVETGEGEGVGSGKSGMKSAELFSPAQTARCTSEVLNLVEGAVLTTGSGSAPPWRSIVTAEDEGGSGNRVVAWSDPFYASPVLEEREGKEGPLLSSAGGTGDIEEESKGQGPGMWLSFGDGRFLESLSDCTPLAASAESAMSQGLRLSFYVDLDSSAAPIGKRQVILDNGGGLQIGVTGLSEGRGRFGVLSVGEGLGLAEACLGHPFLLSVSFRGDESGGVSFEVRKNGVRLPLGDGNSTFVRNLSTKTGGGGGAEEGGGAAVLSALGRLTLGCNGDGKDCFRGQKGGLGVSDRCGDGTVQREDGEECDPLEETAAGGNGGANLCGCNCQSQCAPGHSPQPAHVTEVSVSCGVITAGEWTPIPPPLSCRRDCAVSSAPWAKDVAAGVIKVNKRELLEAAAHMKDGERISVSCEDPMQPSVGQSPAQSLLCTDGVIEPLTLVCSPECGSGGGGDAALAEGTSSAGAGLARSNREATPIMCTKPAAPPVFERAATTKEEEERSTETTSGVDFGTEKISCDGGLLSSSALKCLDPCPGLNANELNAKHLLVNRQEALLPFAQMPAGSTLSLSCETGSEPRALASGERLQNPSSLTCEGDGWAALPLECAEFCLPFEPMESQYRVQVEGGREISEESSSPSLPVGTVVSISCAPGFMPPFGDERQREEILCLGKERGYSENTLICTAPCNSLPDYDKMRLKLTGDSAPIFPLPHGYKIPFECAAGFSPSDPQISEGFAVCQNGAWTEVSLECEGACAAFDLKLLQEAHAVLKGVSEKQLEEDPMWRRHGTEFELECPAGTAASRVGGQRQTETVQCVNGEWSVITLDCARQFRGMEGGGAYPFLLSLVFVWCTREASS
uniref:Sushi domain-containing protein n=1 Tax=Chromera velia CCMP2878 TaxID=1169474 RepID=A0A0G4FAI3_9ALVE|eukprot:Cvel_15902.t1-p1 / transcript=Cvel_15902.t1 / gene=Cvel_15902 / organism=Chromera_velia_CCMP2878 / gene_product=hypothetical protein / transcript_product=hypothetical protein / location=Cvel_scaffold1202:154-5556(-) / protein_length=890 / sequence_SO=supercontig / SO=protein_coding / is_pseudo=false